MTVKTLARLGVLSSLALLLGWVESLFPIAPGAPGVKLGLSNTVLVYALYLMDAKCAWLLMLAKVFLSGFLFSGLTGILYSLAGGVLSLLTMIPLKRGGRLGVCGVSALGAVSHNLGQLLAATVASDTVPLLVYAPVLIVSGALSGSLTGLIAGLVLRALRKEGARE